MPQVLESAKATLTCPLYACDFDPKDATTLVVGGGGGTGKSGIGNKIVRFVHEHCITPQSDTDGGLTSPYSDSLKDVESI